MRRIGERLLNGIARGVLMWFTASVGSPLHLDAANVVTDWNTIASSTVVTNAGKGPGAAAVWSAYSSLAVYDAVNELSAYYRPFYYRGTAPRAASVEAAAASAAHRVLVNYFPSQQT